MKKLAFYVLSLTLFAVVVTSCEPIETSFDKTLLIGKWNSGTVFYRYDNNGSGVTWDTSDDVTEEEAQGFTWTLEQSTLSQIFIMETDGTGVPKIYTVTILTSTTLEYEDSFGKTFSFTKVE